MSETVYIETSILGYLTARSCSAVCNPCCNTAKTPAESPCSKAVTDSHKPGKVRLRITPVASG